MASDDEKKTNDDGRFRELSPGKLLVWARERAGLTQEQVAKELYMTLTKVRALESDDYRHMGSDTFTRGYIRAYANLLKLDVTQVLGAYDRHAQKHGLVEQVLPRRTESPNKPIWQFIALLLLVLFVLWLISVWFFDNRQKSPYNKPATFVPPTETVLSVTQSQVLQASSVTAVSSTASSSSSAVLVDAAVLMLAGDDTSSVLSSTAVPIANSSSSVSSLPISSNNSAGLLDLIQFDFVDECWLEVSDANGDVLIADLRSAGTKVQLQGRAPFDVTLGNAPAAKISLNGDPIDLAPTQGTKVLSLKIGKSRRE